MTTYISSNEYGEAVSKVEDASDDLERLRKELGEILSGKRAPYIAGIDAATVIPPHETIYIVAGNYNEFQQYVTKKDDEWRRRTPDTRNNTRLQPRYIYVQNRNTLLGLNTDIKGYYVGTYKNHPDYGAIKDQIKIIKHMNNEINTL